MRLAFMGTPDFAVTSLAALLAAGHDIAAVYTRAPRPAGRGHELRPSPVEAFARARGLSVRTPRTLRGEAEAQAFEALHLDAAVVVAYGLLLPKEILEAPRLGCLNVHASLLPRWRGAAPIQRAILAGDEETGIAIMAMTEGLDEGPVYAQAKTSITEETTAGSLHDTLAEMGARLLVETLAALAEGRARPRPQAETGTTYARKIERGEGEIDWRRPAMQIARLVRGLAPHPGAFFRAADAKGQVQRLRILRAQAVAGSGDPGEVLAGDGLVIACGEGAISILEVQREGRSALAPQDFLRGFPLPPGARLSTAEQ